MNVRIVTGILAVLMGFGSLSVANAGEWRQELRTSATTPNISRNIADNGSVKTEQKAACEACCQKMKNDHACHGGM